MLIDSRASSARGQIRSRKLLRLWFFDSRVKGSHTPTSDLDIAVEITPEARLQRIFIVTDGTSALFYAALCNERRFSAALVVECYLSMGWALPIPR
jgi:predicted nucleotidyltransferase